MDNLSGIESVLTPTQRNGGIMIYHLSRIVLVSLLPMWSLVAAAVPVDWSAETHEVYGDADYNGDSINDIYITPKVPFIFLHDDIVTPIQYLFPQLWLGMAGDQYRLATVVDETQLANTNWVDLSGTVNNSWFDNLRAKLDTDGDGARDIFDPLPENALFGVAVDPANDQGGSTEYIGKLKGAFQVGDDGSANYQLPIEIPPGINGVQPRLSLVYNSRLGNGLVGMGWSIGGFSKIHRCHASVVRDGYADGIHYDDDYKFCIDGKRLVRVAHNQYRLESENFGKLVRNGTIGLPGSGPDTWTLYQQDGTALIFGQGNALQKEQSRLDAYAWHVSKFVDNNDNEILFHYENDTANGIHRPQSIEYTKRADSLASGTNHKIEFIYETRPDVKQAYIAGSLNKTDKRLSEIKVTSDGAAVSSYLLTYQINGQAYFGKVFNDPNQTSRLASIKRCFSGSTQHCTEPLTFDWSSSQNETNFYSKIDDADLDDLLHRPLAEKAGFTDPPPMGENPTSSVKGDFDGDLKADLVSLVEFSNGASTKIYLTKDSDTERQLVSEVPPEFESAFLELMVLDLNSDGLDDILLRAHSVKQGALALISNGQMLVASPSFNAGGYSIPAGEHLEYDVIYDRGFGPNFLTISYRLTFQDFNGDGLIDILRYPPSSGDDVVFLPPTDRSDISVALNTGTGFSPFQQWMDANTLTDLLGNAYVADINGDQLPDLVASNGAAAINTSTSFVASPSWRLAGKTEGDNRQGSAWVNEPRQTYFFDVNGDGNDDLVHITNPYKISNVFHRDLSVALSTGEGFSALTLSQTYQDVNPNAAFPEDFNGDGCLDIMYFGNVAPRYLQFATHTYTYVYKLFTYGHIFYSNCQGGFFTPISVGFFDLPLPNTPKVRINTVSHEIEQFRSAENDLIKLSYKSLNPFDHRGNYSPDDKQSPIYFQDSAPKLSAITLNSTGMSVSTNLLIGGTNDVTTIITEGKAPVQRRGVSSMETSNGIGGFNRKRYHYFNSAKHPSGYGDLGFEKIEEIEDIAPFVVRKKTTEFSQIAKANYLLAGQPIKETYQAVDVEGLVLRTIKETDYRWQARVWNDDFDSGNFNSPHYFPYLHSAITQYWDIDGAYTHTEAQQNFFDFTFDCTIPQPIVPETSNSAYTAKGNLIYSQQVNCDEFGTAYSAVHNKAFFDFYDLGDVMELPTEQTLHQGVDEGHGLNNTLRDMAYTYTNKGQLESETVTPNDNTTKSTTSYTYSEYGSVASITLDWSVQPSNGLNFSSVTTSYQESFLPNGDRTLVVTNPLSHSETTVYDGRFGTVKQFTDLNGLTTTTSLDALGRPDIVTFADGTTTDYDYFNCDLCDGFIVMPPHDYFIRTKQTGEAAVNSYYDNLDREVLTTHYDFMGELVLNIKLYDALGRLQVESTPFGTGASGMTTYDYDLLDRPTQVTHPDGSTTSIDYSGLTTTTINGNNQQRIQRYNSLDQIKSSQDALGTVISYNYDPQGNLIKTKIQPPGGADAVETTLGYDILGRKLWMNDPDTGYSSWSYNGFNKIYRQTDANLDITEYGYDLIGRQTRRTWGAQNSGSALRTSTWVYDVAPGKGKGQLWQVSGYDTDERWFKEEHSYTQYGLLENTTTTINGLPYTTSHVYDSFNRLAATTYPGEHVTIANIYNDHGYLSAIYHEQQATSLNDFIWRGDAGDAWGNITAETLGNGAVTTRTYQPDTGRIHQIQAIGNGITLQDHEYTFDVLGNLTARKDKRIGGILTESFCYDALNRLISDSFGSCSSGEYTYDSLGNLLRKGDNVPTLAYNNPQPHAVSQATVGSTNISYAYDANGQMIQRGTDIINYSRFGKPILLQGNGNSAEIIYSPQEQRIQRIDSSSRITTYVGGIYEEILDGDMTQNYYVGDLALYSVNNGVGKWHYFHHDHLGSVSAISAEDLSSSNPVEWQAFDAWGQVLDNSWNGNEKTTLDPTERGFTNHEHLLEVGLIHMNGRVYDPLIGRFISPDPLIQSSVNTQSFNRYSYVVNNPLSYTDPTGYSFESDHNRSSRDEGNNGGEDIEEIVVTAPPTRPDFVGGLLYGASRVDLERFVDSFSSTTSFIQGSNDVGFFSLGRAALTAVGTAVVRVAQKLVNKIGSKTKSKKKEPKEESSDRAEQKAEQNQKNESDLSARNDGDVSEGIDKVDDFMSTNAERLDQKLGKKIGQGRLPFERSKAGIKKAKQTVTDTLGNATARSKSFTNSNGDKVFDVFSEKTGFTVRVREGGVFDTLIDAKTDKF